MKKIKSAHIIIILAMILCLSSKAVAQKIPAGLNYESVARNENGFPIAEKEIIVEISIFEKEPNGKPEWQEIHELKTNETGFFSLVIGKGVSTTEGKQSKFEDIDWASDEYYIKTRVDFGSAEYGNGFLPAGVVKIQSVPYSFWSKNTQYADTAYAVKGLTLGKLINIDENTIEAGQGIKWNGTKWETGPMSGGANGDFLKTDGSTDLKGDWTINNNNIILQNGNLSANKLKGKSIRLGISSTITNISNDKNMGADLANDQTLATQKATKTYIDSKITSSNWTLNGNSLYNEKHNIGIGTNKPASKFHANVDNGAFLVSGRLDNSTPIANMGNGIRMVFFPSKAAFRAGEVTEANKYLWDDAYVGRHSFATGRDTRASGPNSFAAGTETSATGSYSFAIGKNCRAMQAGTFATGNNTIADNANSIALNYSTEASGENSLAIGNSAKTGKNANGAFAGGLNTMADGKYSMTFGNEARTHRNGYYSISLGYKTYTKGHYSLATGVGTIARSLAETVFGHYNTTYEPVDGNSIKEWKVTDRLFVVGNGESITKRADAFVILKNGNIGIGKSFPTKALDVTGDVIVSGSLTQGSDLRYKKNITPVNNSLLKINKIRGVYYNWKTDEFPEKKFTEEKQIGFIAQEVEKQFPELVSTDPNGYKAVNYSKMTAVLLQAVKELNKEVEKLKTENTNLKAQINKNVGLEKRVVKMEKQMEQLLKLTNTTKN